MAGFRNIFRIQAAFRKTFRVTGSYLKASRTSFLKRVTEGFSYDLIEAFILGYLHDKKDSQKL
jgi:hypothetical protein